MKQNKYIGTDFTEGKMMPMLLKFMLPFLLANLLNSLYNTVDSIIIGQFVGSAGTLAVSMGGKLLQICTMVSLAFAGGGQVLVSQLYGAKKYERFNGAIGTLFSIMAISSVIIAVIGFACTDPVLRWMNTPEEAFEAAKAYFRVTCVGLPLLFGYNAVSAVLRGMGDSKNPLLFIAIAAAVNLIGDLIFVVVFELGAMGTAIATVIGQGVSLLFSLVLLYRRRERFGFDFKPESFRIQNEDMKIILKIGFPMVLRSCCIQVTQMILLKYVNLYSMDEATAYAIASKIVALTNIFSMSVRQAAGAIIGQNVGASKYKRVGSAVRCCLIITVITSALLSALALGLPEVMFSLFTREAGVIACAGSFAWSFCALYACCALIGTYDSVVTGTGNSKLGFIGGLLDGAVLRLGFGFLFAWGLDMGVYGFFLGDALARIGPIVIGIVYYHSGLWKKYKILKT